MFIHVHVVEYNNIWGKKKSKNLKQSKEVEKGKRKWGNQI